MNNSTKETERKKKHVTVISNVANVRKVSRNWEIDFIKERGRFCPKELCIALLWVLCGCSYTLSKRCYYEPA